MECIIYKITNPNGKVYIGQTINWKLREIHYRKLHCEKQKRLFNSIKKYGYESHKIEFIEKVDSRDKLNERESFWICYYDSFNNGLNLTTGGDSPKRSIETKKKISESKKGASNYMFGRKGELHHLYGKKASEDLRIKLSKSHIGKNLGSKNPYFKGYILAYIGDKFIGEFEGVNDAARKLSLHHNNISKVLNGKRNHTGGYFFKRK